MACHTQQHRIQSPTQPQQKNERAINQRKKQRNKPTTKGRPIPKHATHHNHNDHGMPHKKIGIDLKKHAVEFSNLGTKKPWQPGILYCISTGCQIPFLCNSVLPFRFCCPRRQLLYYTPPISPPQVLSLGQLHGHTAPTATLSGIHSIAHSSRCSSYWGCAHSGASQRLQGRAMTLHDSQSPRKSPRRDADLTCVSEDHDIS